MSQNMSKFVAFDASNRTCCVHCTRPRRLLCLLGIPGLCCHNRSATSSRRDYKSQTLLARENGRVHRASKQRDVPQYQQRQTANMTRWKVGEKACVLSVSRMQIWICVFAVWSPSLWNIGAIERGVERERAKIKTAGIIDPSRDGKEALYTHNNRNQ